jgi:hypothetical protein
LLSLKISQVFIYTGNRRGRAKMSLKKIENPLFNGPRQQNALKAWIYFPGKGRQSFHVGKDEKPKGRGPTQVQGATHFLLRGGRWNIPVEFNDEFLFHYAISMQQGHQFSLVERRTPWFRYHIDLDFGQKEQVTLEMLRSYVFTIQDTLRRFFPLADNIFFDCLVSSAEIKELIDKTSAPGHLASSAPLIKSGFHLIWPHIWVTQQQALEIRAALLFLVTKQFGERKPPTQNLWQDVIDESIYIANGLRMIGATKWARCKCRQNAVKNQKAPKVIPSQVPPTSSGSPNHGEAVTEICEHCQNQGYIYEGRPYWLVAAWDYQGADIDRSIIQPLEPLADAPIYTAPKNYYLPTTTCVFPATTCPILLTSAENDEQAEMLETLIEEGQAREVSYQEAFVFGDPVIGERGKLAPLEPLYDPLYDPLQGAVSAWESVHRLHNTLRFTSLRIPNDLLAFIEDLWPKIQAGDPRAEAEYSERLPLYKKPAFSPAAASVQDIEERKNFEQSRKVKYDTRGKRIELLNEFKESQNANLRYVTDEQLISDVQTFIQSRVGLSAQKPQFPFDNIFPYKDVEVSNIIYKVGKGGAPPSQFFVHVVGFGSAYCQNKQGDHNRHSIYFEIGTKKDKKKIVRKKTSRKYIFQRCFCRCNEERIAGLCKNFRKLECEVPSSITQRLVGQEAAAIDNPGSAPQKAQPIVAPAQFDMEQFLRDFSGGSSAAIDMEGFEAFKREKRQREGLEEEGGAGRPLGPPRKGHRVPPWTP